MILINNVIVNDDVVQSEFACNLHACKGACCWEGDFGAPLAPDEVETYEENKELLLTLVMDESKSIILDQGTSIYFKEPKFQGTPLHANGACVYLVQDGLIFTCAIEKAKMEGRIDFNKPVSCHLYPVRVEKDHATGFETMNYDRWDICSAACDRGEKEGVKVFEFVKEGIIRAYGEEFYQQLLESAALLNEE